MAETEQVMLCRSPSFADYWEPDISFGPMPRGEAEMMAATEAGGYILTIEEWNLAVARRQVV